MSRATLCLGLLLATLPAGLALAHGVGGSDARYLQTLQGFEPVPLAYFGAKHMVTGHDHLLYLAGVTFFLSRLRDVATYVTLFAVGHSATLLLGVLGGVQANPHGVDALIGLSVVYKALENLGGLRHLGRSLAPRAAVLAFGLVHGFGLATRLQALQLPAHGRVGNLLAFNLGVELGQFAALTGIWLLLQAWRQRPAFVHQAYGANVVLMSAGFVLFGSQLAGWLLTRGGAA